MERRERGCEEKNDMAGGRDERAEKELNRGLKGEVEKDGTEKRKMMEGEER